MAQIEVIDPALARLHRHLFIKLHANIRVWAEGLSFTYVLSLAASSDAHNDKMIVCDPHTQCHSGKIT
jgi:hypothetical protein